MADAKSRVPRPGVRDRRPVRLGILLLLAATRLVAANCTGLGNSCYTFVFIPDPQNMVQGGARNADYTGMFSWIVSNQSNWNIKAVLSLGDVVNTPYCNLFNYNNCDGTTNGTNCGASLAPLACTVDWTSTSDGEDVNGFQSGAYASLDAAGIPYLLIPGNHDYSPNCTGPADPNFQTSCKNRVISQSWLDTVSSGHNVPSPGPASPAAFVNRGGVWTSEASQFWPPSGGANRGSHFGIVVSGVKWRFIGLGFYEPHAAGNDAITWAKNVALQYPSDNVVFVTHAGTYGNNAGNAGSQHTAALMGYSGTALTAAPGYYGLDSTNSTSGADMFTLLCGAAPNTVVCPMNGHSYDAATTDDHWWFNTGTASDGHTVIYGGADYQDIDMDQGVAQTFSDCPTAPCWGSVHAEVAYVVLMTVRNNNSIEWRILSTHTGDFVANGAAVPSSSNPPNPVRTDAVTLILPMATVSAASQTASAGATIR